MSIIFSESDKHFNPESLEGKSKEIYEASVRGGKENYKPEKEVKEAMKLDENRARYKIEIILSTDRKSAGTSACALTVFRSGGAIHGGGDEVMYFCRSEKDRSMGCGSILKGDVYVGQLGNEMVSVYKCEKCNKYVNRELLASTILYKLPINQLAMNIYHLFRQLDSNADIYLKHIKVDIRDAAERGRKGMPLIPKKTDYVIYTVKNIIKDTNNDSQVLQKFINFLKA
jgi:hypothetical protein